MQPDNLVALRDLLVAEGQAALKRSLSLVRFTGNDQADTLLNDLDRFPHAYLFACLVDRQVPAEWAWMVPATIRAGWAPSRWTTLWRSTSRSGPHLRNPPRHTVFPGYGDGAVPGDPEW